MIGFSGTQIYDPGYGEIYDPGYGEIYDSGYGEIYDPGYGNFTFCYKCKCNVM